MKVTYLSHSGFFVQLEKTCLLFDYYKGTLPEPEADKTLVVFVSHSHYDHYNRDIWGIEGYKDIIYCLSNDIYPTFRSRGKKAVVFSPGEDRALPGTDIRVRTLRSTDAGVAYAVECEGRSVYHAGDLNVWAWDDEDVRTGATQAYEREISKLRGESFDCAFVPLDPRLGAHAGDGMDIFLRDINAKAVFPMHFWGKPQIIAEYLSSRADTPRTENIIRLDKEGTTYEI